MLQRRVCMLQLKIPRVKTKTPCCQINKIIFSKKDEKEPSSRKNFFLAVSIHNLFFLKRMPSQVVLVVKNPLLKAGNIRDTSLIPGLGRCPGGRHGNPLQYSCQETLMDRGGWWATAHGVTKNRTRLSDLAHTHIMPIRMHREIKIKSFAFLKHKIQLGIWHWFSWIRTYLQWGRFHHGKSPQ